MKIKNITRIISIFSLVFLIALMTGNRASAHTNAKMEEKWETSKSIKSTKKGIQYHAYISKDKKEAWIYKIRLKSKKVTKLEFPSKIKGKKVTTLGAVERLYPDDRQEARLDACLNILRESFEPWHGAEVEKTNKIKKIKLPNTVKQLGSATLAGFPKVKKIILSSNITSLKSYQFYGDKEIKSIEVGGKCKEIGYYSFGRCKKLKTVKFGKKVSSVDSDAFTECYKLTSFIVNKKNKYLSTKNGLLLTKNKKKLLIAPCAKKKVKIPEGVVEIGDNALCDTKVKEIWVPRSVRKIGETAFDMTDLKKWHIAKGSVLKKTKSCVYSEETGELIYLFFAKSYSTVKLPEGIKRINTRFSKENGAGNSESLYLPKSLTEINSHGWRGSLCKHLYFTSIEPPKVISSDQMFEGWSVMPHIPAANKLVYLNWLEKNFFFNRESDEYAVF